MERDAHAVERQHDVGVEDRGVDAEPVHRHRGDPRAELRRARDLEDPEPLAERAVLLEAAAGLAHEPDRRTLDGLAPAGADEERGGHVTSARAAVPSTSSSASASPIARPTKIGVSRSVYEEDSVSRSSATSATKRRTSSTSKATTNS